LSAWSKESWTPVLASTQQPVQDLLLVCLYTVSCCNFFFTYLFASDFWNASHHCNLAAEGVYHDERRLVSSTFVFSLHLIMRCRAGLFKMVEQVRQSMTTWGQEVREVRQSDHEQVRESDDLKIWWWWETACPLHVCVFPPPDHEV
jgi:hypothetical protein